MIRLTIVRHAKSDWSSPDLADHDRPLNARGRRDAPVMAERLASTGARPTVILSSTAVRARTTAEAFARVLGVDVRPDPDLYGASAADLLAAASGSGLSDVMVVAHDPGMTDLADRLSRGRIDRMPTCAIATFAWDVEDWSLIDAVDPVSWEHLTPR
ncbi:histidine phosphatase family protein [Microbacterium sp. SSW1-59]|uniref:SixA phosphatase family protein n=1 Tax=Microbacterium xanthum TaxID=3079794 RepID=UPI002AD44188|nr:histidine phosphatase family protein [Microbacterium sp. SSW1-59]MDZ8199908.1 histidine phosphatase family protein [Microbacterium sp. SSW1-59]